jgi:hypothetical protein
VLQPKALAIGPPRALPSCLRRLPRLERPGAAGARRTLNNLFAFGAISYTGRQLKFSGPQNVVITGRVYHRMLDLDADQGSLRWFLFDERGHYRAGEALKVLEHMIAACKALLEAHSPYVRTLRYAVQTAGRLALRPPPGLGREGGCRSRQPL